MITKIEFNYEPRDINIDEFPLLAALQTYPVNIEAYSEGFLLSLDRLDQNGWGFNYRGDTAVVFQENRIYVQYYGSSLYRFEVPDNTIGLLRCFNHDELIPEHLFEIIKAHPRYSDN